MASWHHRVGFDRGADVGIAGTTIFATPPPPDPPQEFQFSEFLDFEALNNDVQRPRSISDRKSTDLRREESVLRRSMDCILAAIYQHCRNEESTIGVDPEDFIRSSLAQVIERGPQLVLSSIEPSCHAVLEAIFGMLQACHGPSLWARAIGDTSDTTSEPMSIELPSPQRPQFNAITAYVSPMSLVGAIKGSDAIFQYSDNDFEPFSSEHWGSVEHRFEGNSGLQQTISPVPAQHEPSILLSPAFDQARSVSGIAPSPTAWTGHDSQAPCSSNDQGGDVRLVDVRAISGDLGIEITPNDGLSTPQRDLEGGTSQDRPRIRPMNRPRRVASRSTAGQLNPRPPIVSHPLATGASANVAFQISALSSMGSSFENDLPHRASSDGLDLLCRLHNAIGSGTALRQLAEACDVHDVDPLGLPNNDFRSVVMCILHIRKISSLHHILRRYLLVRLIVMRRDMARKVSCICKTCKTLERGDQQLSGMLQIDMGYEISTRVISVRFDTDNNTVAKRGAPRCLALDELLRDAYDDQHITRLRNRIVESMHLGLPWCRLAERFGIGILALIPTDTDLDISSSKVEKDYNAEKFTIFLNTLEKNRGVVLKKAALALKPLYARFLGANTARRTWKFESSEMVFPEEDGNIDNILSEMCQMNHE